MLFSLFIVFTDFHCCGIWIIPDKIRDPFFPGNTKRSEALGECSEHQS